MKRAFMITMMVALFVASAVGLGYARQGGRGNGPGWSNCPYRQGTASASVQQSKSGWYCPRSGTWTKVRNHYGPRGSGGGYGYGQGGMNSNQPSANK